MTEGVPVEPGKQGRVLWSGRGRARRRARQREGRGARWALDQKSIRGAGLGSAWLYVAPRYGLARWQAQASPGWTGIPR